MPRSSVREPGLGWLGSSWCRAARSSEESRLLHNCSSCSRAAIWSQRPGPRGPWIAQPAEGRQDRPQGAAPGRHTGQPRIPREEPPAEAEVGSILEKGVLSQGAAWAPFAVSVVR